ncbi:hypothetical protein LguiB_000138 [Lonicera macranthoides]
MTILFGNGKWHLTEQAVHAQESWLGGTLRTYRCKALQLLQITVMGLLIGRKEFAVASKEYIKLCEEDTAKSLVGAFESNSFDVRNNLENKFRTCGVIRDVYLPKKLNGPAMPGTAFIVLDKEDAVKEAIKLRGRGPNELKVHGPIYPYISVKVKNEGGYGGIYGYGDSQGKFHFRP